ncbi:MAG: HAD hydrolase-like protein, partial [Clostridia bacterium]|nr:HAD hydrolase-like protein [Clostridia bacterium]
MKFKTAVFDLDGTLIDTLEDLKNSVNYALSKYDYPQRTYEEIKSFVGNGVARLVYLSAPDCADDKIKEDLLSIFKKHYVDNSAVFTAPYDGIKELLAELKSAGVNTAVVTNKMQEAAKDLVNRFFGSDIDIVIGQVDGLAQKPQPDGVWKAIESLGSSLEESVYIGDSEVD